ncbi:MAG: F0F1 ATP synthase subunit A [Lachnospirales bacterium]
MGVDFNNHYYGTINIGSFPIWITDTVISTLIIAAILVIFTIYVNISIRKFKRIPKGFQNVIECLVDMMDKFTRSTMGDENGCFAFWFFGVFVFILFSNLSGLLGMRPPTADLATTLALGLTTFGIIHIGGMVKNTKQYFKDYVDPYPFFLPINLIGELALPVSLSFRLFGNILGGLIILGMVYSALPTVLKFVIPPVLHGYFDVFSGSLQAYIFVILSLTFIAQKLPSKEGIS